MDLSYDDKSPVTKPIILELPANGLRLRFDGPSQTLRLIEITDFTKSKLQYAKDRKQHATRDIFRSDTETRGVAGPDFKHIYSLFGPSFPGEYVGADSSDTHGIYVHSYPGLAFTFPVLKSAWSTDKDPLDLLSSSATLPATSMAVYFGNSWPDVRNNLFTMELPEPRTLLPGNKNREVTIEEISCVKILGGGRLELQRHRAPDSVHIRLGYTTPQHLVAQLGPPDAIYRRAGQELTIHKARATSDALQGRPGLVKDDMANRDSFSGQTSADISDDEFDNELSGSITTECFYNYFYQGFDILIAPPALPSMLPPTQQENHAPKVPSTAAPLVATKIVLHCNVPGSYSFQRHRRVRWEIAYLSGKSANSEAPFSDIAALLHKEWRGTYHFTPGMPLNRGWGDSPSSSCEFLGGWEESNDGERIDDEDTDGSMRLGNTTLHGYPGLVFEVLKNGFISGLTVF